MADRLGHREQGHEHHRLSGVSADRTEAQYQGKRLDDEPMDRSPGSFPVRYVPAPHMPVLGGVKGLLALYPTDPERRRWISEIYAETGDFS